MLLLLLQFYKIVELLKSTKFKDIINAAYIEVKMSIVNFISFYSALVCPIKIDSNVVKIKNIHKD